MIGPLDLGTLFLDDSCGWLQDVLVYESYCIPVRVMPVTGTEGITAGRLLDSAISIRLNNSSVASIDA